MKFTNSLKQLAAIAKAMCYKIVYSELNELCGCGGGLAVRNEKGILISFNPKEDVNQLLKIIKKFKVDISWLNNNSCDATVWKKVIADEATYNFEAVGHRVEKELEDAVLAAVRESLDEQF